VQPWLDDGDVQLYHGDALDVLRALPAGIAQTCVTSPPYWGLRDYNAPGQLGLEATPTQYVENMVNLFREVRRVLRDDGTLWLNLGDSYASSGKSTPQDISERYEDYHNGRRNTRWEASVRAPTPDGLKPKDLVGIPWKVAFALQADGWFLRSDIIWSKPNPMPENVSDRPTKAHEYVFLFSKQPRYFYDADAIREASDWGRENNPEWQHARAERNGQKHPANRNALSGGFTGWTPAAGRNRRSVWTIPTEPQPEAHFATYPQALVQPCILAGTSEHGECVECGAPWRRVVTAPKYEPPVVEAGVRKVDESRQDKTRKLNGKSSEWKAAAQRETTGWEPSCSCAATTRPQLVLDPFVGSGTTALVARKHGRRCIGIDLSADYLAIAAKRTQQLSLLGVAP
jgi:DNA modification methylase